MLSFNPRDRAPVGKDAAKSSLKPAIYEPPAAGPAAPHPGVVTRPVPAPATAAPAPSPIAQAAPSASSSPSLAPQPGTPASLANAVEPAPSAPLSAPSPAPAQERAQSKLAVGVNIKLKGVEISDCDVFMIEGQVEATVHSKAMEIAPPGTLTGTAHIDVAEIHGEFSGELTARAKLIVHGTGRVSGKIRYGKLVVAEGGELSGDVKRLDDSADAIQLADARARAS